jgi:glycerol-3-phosphate cytidylyltransferase
MFNIGFTTGVFDLFHIGHLNILRKAKENCNYLIVGINTDELVQKYKNKTPIIPYSERRAIIEAIRYVDKVIPQENQDYIEAYSRLKFDVMFIGDDWKGSPLYLNIEKNFKVLGVEVMYFPYTKGTSSTMLTNVLNKLIT